MSEQNAMQPQSAAPAEDEEEWGLEPPDVAVDRANPLWPAVSAALQSVYDPEIPVDIYRLGLIYAVEFEGEGSVHITMSLTAPGCPVAGEMPGMVERAVQDAEGVKDVTVELVWDPPWHPGKMSDLAKMELNIY